MLVKLLRHDRQISLNPYCKYTPSNDSLLVTYADKSSVLNDKVACDLFFCLAENTNYDLATLSDVLDIDLSLLIYKCSDWIGKNYFLIAFDNIALCNQQLYYVKLGLNLNDLCLEHNATLVKIKNFSRSLENIDQTYFDEIFSQCTPLKLAGKTIVVYIVDEDSDQTYKKNIYDSIQMSNNEKELHIILILKYAGLLISSLLSRSSSPCAECLFTTLEESNEISIFQERMKTSHYDGSKFALSGYIDSSVLPSLIHTNIIKRLYSLDYHAPEDDYIEYIDFLGRDEQKYHVLRKHLGCSNPKCKIIYDPIANMIEDLSLERKIERSQSGYRSITTSKFIKNTQHLISPLTGVVKYLSKVEETESDMYHVYDSGHNWAVHANSLTQLKSGLRTNSQGKGATEAQAKAGAIAEAVERFSAIQGRNEKYLYSSEHDMQEPFVPLDVLLKISDRQYLNRDDWNKHNYRFAHIPLKHDSSTLLEWSSAYNLMNQSKILIPSSYLFFHYQWPNNDHAYAIACSNGLSVGSNCQDSIIQGFLELVERDAVGIWWYNMYQCPGILPSSFGSTYINELYQFYQNQNREFYFLNLTTDLGIPVIAAISYRVDKTKKDILMAFGAHFDPLIAAQRALGEMNQFFPAVSSIKDDSDSNYNYDDPQSLHWWSTATLDNQPYLAPSHYGEPPAHYFNNKQPMFTSDIVEEIKSLCRHNGFDLYAYNYTKPNIGISCTKTIVPQLSHFWARFNCDRLYEVPISLGRANVRPDENDFNSIPMFL